MVGRGLGEPERAGLRDWAALDPAAREALSQAWDAVRSGNIGVGAVITNPAGEVVVATRNRVADSSAPPGEIAGSSVAHAELNALARIAFRSARELTLTTTLQPCLQCAAAIRMAPIARVRVLGSDRLWDGCHDFTSLNPWVARRPPVPQDGPRRDTVGAFATLISRFGLGLIDTVETQLRELGEGPLIDLAVDIQQRGDLPRLTILSVEEAFLDLWPHLATIAGV